MVYIHKLVFVRAFDFVNVPVDECFVTDCADVDTVHREFLSSATSRGRRLFYDSAYIIAGDALKVYRSSRR